MTSVAPMQLLTVADKDYLPYLGCHLVSLGDYVPEHLLHITIVHRGISETQRRELGQRLPKTLQLHWVEPTIPFLKRIGAPLAFSTVSPHYFRLLAPFLLPTASRAIYLDADTIIMGSIDPLWTVDLDGNVVAAVQDYLPCIADAVSNWKDLALDPDALYFNSGVLVLDLNQWRSQRVPVEVLDVCQKHTDHLLAQQKWPQYDQYGLNVVLHGRWKALDQVWNHGAAFPPPSTPARIVHYAGNGKPGLATCQQVYNNLFLDVLKRTSYRLMNNE